MRSYPVGYKITFLSARGRIVMHGGGGVGHCGGGHGGWGGDGGGWGGGIGSGGGPPWREDWKAILVVLVLLAAFCAYLLVK